MLGVSVMWGALPVVPRDAAYGYAGHKHVSLFESLMLGVRRGPSVPRVAPQVWRSGAAGAGWHSGR